MILIFSMRKAFLLAFVGSCLSHAATHAEQLSSANIAVSAPIDTQSAGKNGDVAEYSVFRILCRSQHTMGTGFLHKSGNVITAAHVVKNCPEPELLLGDRPSSSSRVIAADSDLDIAIIAPTFPIEAKALSLSTKTDLKIGTQVSTWGFPWGYNGSKPMLSVGYVSGIQGVKVGQRLVAQWVINAAFNSGNSGGPLLEIETGEVIGIVSSKVAPLSDSVKVALEALSNDKSGFQYDATYPDGSKKTISEAQVIAVVLEELRNQVQIVIGNAVRIEDLRSFLILHKIAP